MESDWSAASYWYEIAALVPGAVVELSGLHDVSVQGDSRVSEFFAHLGVETDFLHDGVRLRHVGMSDRSCLVGRFDQSARFGTNIGRYLRVVA